MASNDIGVHNGNIFGFEVSEEEADLVIIPVPWDVTASFRKGTAYGPQAILDASVQLDFFHPCMHNACEAKIYMTPISEEWLKLSEEFNDELKNYFIDLEEGKGVSQYKDKLYAVNDAQTQLCVHLQERAGKLIEQGKTVAVLGGEHSAPMGLLRKLKKQYDEFGILQIDAHADLRDCYEGFDQSHASIMHNALKHHVCTDLVAVGVRDLCEKEMHVYNHDERCHVFTDWHIKEKLAAGENWDALCDRIVTLLPDDVYISFDIDGLSPELCPNTGTPVPGGLSFDQAYILLRKVVKNGKRIIGFDLCEVAPDKIGNKSSWDANVGARILFELSILTLLSSQDENKI